MIYAEDLNFWKTGRSDPDSWIIKTKKQIEALGGIIKAEGFGMSEGKAAFMIAFNIKEDSFKIVWPVLPTYKGGEEKAAKIQAATMLYHYIKGICLYSLIVGPRTAFFSHFMIDGKRTSEYTNAEIAKMIPQFLLSHKEI